VKVADIATIASDPARAETGAVRFNQICGRATYYRKNRWKSAVESAKNRPSNVFGVRST
jgi:hypothetical protein